MSTHPVDDTHTDVAPVEPVAEELAAAGVVDGAPAGGEPAALPPVPGPPPGVPDDDWPDGGRPPVNPGVLDPG